MSALNELIADRLETLRAITGETEVPTDSVSAMEPAYIVMHLDIAVTLAQEGFSTGVALKLCPTVVEFMVLGYSDRVGHVRAAIDLAHILMAFDIPDVAASDAVLEIRELGVDLAESLKRLGTVAHGCGWTIRQTLAALSVLPHYGGVEERAELLRNIMLELASAEHKTQDEVQQ